MWRDCQCVGVRAHGGLNMELPWGDRIHRCMRGGVLGKVRAFGQACVQRCTQACVGLCGHVRAGVLAGEWMGAGWREGGRVAGEWVHGWADGRAGGCNTLNKNRSSAAGFAGIQQTRDQERTCTSADAVGFTCYAGRLARRR